MKIVAGFPPLKLSKVVLVFLWCQTVFLQPSDLKKSLADYKILSTNYFLTQDSFRILGCLIDQHCCSVADLGRDIFMKILLFILISFRNIFF